MTNKLNKVAFVTYNTLGIASGVHQHADREAFVLQNSTGRGSLAEGKRTMNVNEIGDEISRLWEQIGQMSKELDHIVVYVGARGSERAIALAAQLPAEKITFIGCSCGLPAKEAMVQAAGLDKARRIMCECGGHKTMERMINSFLDTGSLGIGDLSNN